MVKRFISISILAVLLASCSPSRHAIHVEMRHPSRSGMELAGKIVSVISMSGDDQRENIICENMSDAFAKALEEGYGTGEGSVGLFCVDRNHGDYTGRDSLVSLLMQTGSDLVFLMDTRQSGEMTASGLPVRVSIYAFDAMDKEEKVKHFTGTKVLAASTDEGLAVEAAKTGKLVADPFEAQWKQEQYSVAYYDTVKWYESLVKAEQYDWKGAMEIWIELLDTRDLMKKASAEYNIAVACYMMGDYYLAEEWLDRSDADNKLPTLSDGLRKRIEARKR